MDQIVAGDEAKDGKPQGDVQPPASSAVVSGWKQIGSLQERVAAARALTELFKMERVTYLVFTGVSVLILLVSITASLLKDGTNYAAMTGMFGSSGLVTITTGRLLTMWSKLVREVFAIGGQESEE